MGMAIIDSGQPSTASDATQTTLYVYRSSSNCTFISSANSTSYPYYYFSNETRTKADSGVRSGNPNWIPHWHHFYKNPRRPDCPLRIIPTRAVDRRARSIHTYRPRIPVWSARRWKSLT